MLIFVSNMNDYFLQNLWWIVLVILLGISLLGVSLYFLLRQRKKKEKNKEVKVSELAALLGGNENILSHELKGSRIILSLKDYSLLEEANLRALGVTGFIRKTDQITLVVKEKAKEVYEKLFKE